MADVPDFGPSCRPRPIHVEMPAPHPNSHPHSTVVADEAAAVAAALGRLIAGDPRFHLLAVTSSGSDTIAMIRLHRPDLAVVDHGMLGDDESSIEKIREASPATVIVAVTASDSPFVHRRMRDAGADLCVAKGDPTAELLDRLATAGRRPRRS
jgi:DNA-binding NarL/FixJ family response regulator